MKNVSAGRSETGAGRASMLPAWDFILCRFAIGSVMYLASGKYRYATMYAAMTAGSQNHVCFCELPLIGPMQPRWMFHYNHA